MIFINLKSGVPGDIFFNDYLNILVFVTLNFFHHFNYIFNFFKPRHFRARHKSNDFRRLSDGMDVSDDEGGGQQLQSNNSFEINQLHQGDQIQHSQSERRLHQRNDESEALRMDEELDEECDDEEEEEYEENSRSSFSRKLSSPAQRIINNVI